MGYLGVEFFFIVSGYLMAQKALNMKNYKDEDIGKLTWNYIWKKIKVLFPYVLINYLISIVVKSTFRDFKTYQYVRSIWNLLFIDMSGITTTYMLGQTWYISAMLISMLILYPLILKYKKNFIYLGSPVIVLFIGGFLSRNYANLNLPYIWENIIMLGMLRALFEIALGTIIYEVTENIKKFDFTLVGKLTLTAIEILCFTGILLVIYKNSKNYDFIVLLLMTIATTIAFSKNNILYKFYNNKFFYYLEKLSLIIYLDHIWIRDIVVRHFNQSENIKLLISLILTILISIILEFIMNKLKNMLNKKRNIFIRKTK